MRLDECGEIVGGATPKTSNADYWDGPVMWATPKELSDLDGAYISTTERTITEEGLKSCSSRVLPPGSVLLSSRAPIGHTAINRVPMATNQGFKSIVPRSGRLDAKYLLHWLRKNRPRLEKMGNGATFKELSKKRVSEIAIPLPPIEVQQRIADVLDRANELRAKRRRAIEQLEGLKQSIFLDMFGGGSLPPVWPAQDGSRHPSGWSRELLTDVSRLATGHTPDRTRSDYWGGHIPWITTGDIRGLDGSVATDTKQHITDLGERNSSAVKLPSGTVCFCRTASVGFVTMMGREMTTSQDFVNWVCGPKLDPTYLLHALLASRNALRNISDGSTHKTIYFPTVERFRVLVPPRDLQERFVNRVRVIRPAESTAEASASTLAELAQSLEQRAFAGAL